MEEYSLEYLKELADKVHKWLSEEIPIKRRECKEAGSHKDIIWFPYFITGSSSHRDTVYGMCKYCLTPLDRSLNDDEHEGIEDLRKSMFDRITI